MFHIINQYKKNFFNFLIIKELESGGTSMDIKEKLENKFSDSNENLEYFLKNFLKQENISNKTLNKIISFLEEKKDEVFSDGEFSKVNFFKSLIDKVNDLKISRKTKIVETKQKTEKLKENLIKKDKKIENKKQENFKEKVKEEKKELTEKQEKLSKSGKNIINYLVKNLENNYNAPDLETDNGEVELEKTNVLGTSEQLKEIINTAFRNDRKIINFFKEIPEFQNISNTQDLEKILKTKNTNEIFKILDYYTDKDRGISFAVLMQIGPKKALKEKSKILIEEYKKDYEKYKLTKEIKKELEKKFEKENQEINNQIQNHLSEIQNKGYSQKQVINGKEVSIISQDIKNNPIVTQIIKDKVENQIYENIGNLTLSGTNFDGINTISTNLNVSKILEKINISEEITKFFEKINSNITVSAVKGDGINTSIVIIGGEIFKYDINKKVSLASSGYVGIDGFGAETGLYYKIGETTQASLGIGANIDFKKFEAIIGPYIGLDENIDLKIQKSLEDYKKSFEKVKNSIINNESYNKDFSALISKEEFEEIGELYKILKQESEKQNINPNDILNGVFFEKAVKKTIKEYKGFNFSNAKLSLIETSLNPQLAGIKFILSSLAGSKIIANKEKKYDLNSQEEILDKNLNKEKITSEIELKNFLEQNNLKLENGFLIIPENSVVFGDKNITRKGNKIGGNISSIKIIKIVGEDNINTASKVTMQYQAEKNISYKIILNNASEELKQTKKLEKINFNFQTKEYISKTEYLKTTDNIENIDFLKTRLEKIGQNIDIHDFRDNPKNKDFWIALISGNRDEVIEKYSKNIKELGIDFFDNLNKKEKYYVVDYIASLSSKFDYTKEKFVGFDSKKSIEFLRKFNIGFKENSKYPFIYNGKNYGAFHLIKTLEENKKFSQYFGEIEENIKKLHNYNIDFKDFENKNLKKLFKEFNENFAIDFSKHKKLVKKFEGKNNNLQTNYIDGIFGFVSRSPLTKDGKKSIFKGSGTFLTGISVLSANGESWENYRVKIDDKKSFDKIVGNFDDNMLEELKSLLKVDKLNINNEKFKEILKQKASDIFDFYLAKDAGFDDVIIIEVKNKKRLQEKSFSAKSFIIQEGKYISKEAVGFDLGANYSYIKLKPKPKPKEPEPEEPTPKEVEEEPKKPEDLERPLDPEKPEGYEKTDTIDLDWDGAKIIYEDLGYTNPEKNKVAQEKIEFIKNIIEENKDKNVEFIYTVHKVNGEKINISITNPKNINDFLDKLETKANGLKLGEHLDGFSSKLDYTIKKEVPKEILEKYNSLINKKSSLSEQIQNLEKEKQKLESIKANLKSNEEIKEYNAKIDNIDKRINETNKRIQEYNKVVQTFNQIVYNFENKYK